MNILFEIYLNFTSDLYSANNDQPNVEFIFNCLANSKQASSDIVAESQQTDLRSSL